MPTPVSYPYGPWTLDGRGITQEINPQYNDPHYQPPTFFSFGPDPYRATISHSASGTTTLPYVPLLFDESPNVWADSMLSTAELSASVRANNNMFW